MGNFMITGLGPPRPWSTDRVPFASRVGGKYEFRRVLGAGAAGIAVHVADLSDPADAREAVIKFQRVNDTFREELAIMRLIQAGLPAQTQGSTAFPVVPLLDGFVVSLQAFLDLGWSIRTENPDVAQFVGEFEKLADPRLGVLVMGHADRGDLDNYLKNTVLDPVPRAFLGYSLTLGLAYLHSLGVQHRDVDTTNAVVSSLPAVVAGGQPGPAGDFVFAATLPTGFPDPTVTRVSLVLPAAQVTQTGLAQYIDYGASQRNVREGLAAVEQAVTRIFSRAPELFYGIRQRSSDGVFDDRSDVWSLGTVLLQIGYGGQLLKEIRYIDRKVAKRHADRIRAFCVAQVRAQEQDQKSAAITDFLCLDSPTSIIDYFNILVEIMGPPPPSVTTALRVLIGPEFTAALEDIIEFTAPRVGMVFRTPRLVRALGPRGISMVRRMLQWRPAQRPRALELLGDPYFTSLLQTTLVTQAETADDDGRGKRRKVGNPFRARSTSSLTAAELPAHIVWATEAQTSASLDKCAVCPTALDLKVHVCTGCRARLFCSEKCGLADWKNPASRHRTMCHPAPVERAASR